MRQFRKITRSTIRCSYAAQPAECLCSAKSTNDGEAWSKGLASPRRQIARDVAGIEIRANEGTNPAARFAAACFSRIPNCRVIKVSAKNAFGCRLQLVRHWRLSPPDNLGIGPSSLNGVGPVRAVAANDNVRTVFADCTVTRSLEVSEKCSNNKLGCGPQPSRNR